MAEIVSLTKDLTDRSFEAEVSGSDSASSALVLVHGFGVRRDSRGMFTDIRQRYENRLMVASMDLSTQSDTGTDAVPFGQQLARLKAVIEHLKAQRSVEKLTLLGHSMGSLVVAQTNDEIVQKKILLAPPLGYAFEEFIQTPGWSRPGSSLDLNGTSTLQRSDGSITTVPSAFWDEFKAMGNVDNLYYSAAEQTESIMVYAGEDNVFGHQTPLAGISHVVIPASDHDFQGVARQPLLDTLDGII